ncbi:MAG: hypothetical protein ACODAE_02200 [Gemmatimonadota bacterium]
MTRPDRVSAEAFLARRRSEIERTLGRRLVPPPPPTELPPAHRRFLREEAEELYWNELAWEGIATGSGQDGLERADVVFAALLAFIDGLLVREPRPGGAAPARPRPGVVEEILRFLAERRLRLDPAASAAGDRARGPGPTRREPSIERERGLTDRLIDLVLYRLHAVTTTGGHAGAPPRRLGDGGAMTVGGDG